jgi:catechol 2,3-dioxygenase-like lactoylglutathione lyase family enzyme
MANERFDDRVVFQIAFVTDDIDRTRKWFAGLFGMDEPTVTVTGPRSETEAEYKSLPSDARCKLAFFELGNTTIELIEPDEHPSCWRDFLDAHGPGCHHLAFKVNGMKQKLAAFEKSGHPLLQKGEFTGGRYAYVDTEPQLGILVELLEFDRQ